MAADLTLDSTDRAILSALQADGRLSMTDLAGRVSMSASAVTERVRRLEERGVVDGYAAVVAPASVGHAILAFVRLRYPSTKYQPFYDLIDRTPEILEVHHVTGEDCFIIKVASPSMAALEDTTARIGQLGAITTNIVYSSPLPRRAVTPAS
ncbi:Lrp/AsnC family transcriptional regulator [Demequina sp. NBRC 110053]|uniref:Lrp/AsnC family transcriptional regulator n=1 Tax=Demequina sp. NBRC 110053 TaxID=1570342 RepID=UPI000A007B70|nr:Lrp/AsnC family transcriptional regulator [Demequina sp. NBRC 110053]